MVETIKCVGGILIGILSFVGMLLLVSLAAFSVFAAALGLGAAMVDHNIWLGIGCAAYLIVALLAFLRASA